ncbi:MAG: RDD family protein [Chloroflexota bacterium]|nr:RDD family protein [Chloroflexota bacterium]
METARFGSRFSAWFIDWIGVGLAAGVLAGLLGLVTGLYSGTDSDLLALLVGGLALLMAAVLWLVQFLYFGYFWSKDGQSLGMKALGIQVVRRNEEPLSFLRAGLRGTVGYWISGLIFGLGYIWAAFDHDGEAWHDKIFDTRVLERR